MSDKPEDRLKSLLERTREAQDVAEEMTALTERLRKVTRKVEALRKNPKGKGALKTLAKLGQEGVEMNQRMAVLKDRYNELLAEGGQCRDEAPAAPEPALGAIPTCPHCGGDIEDLLRQANTLGMRFVAQQVLHTCRPLLTSLRAGGDAMASLVGALEKVLAGPDDKDKAH
jgi:hypothetical protein